MKSLGAVACGHAETAKAAESILREGGNAFDAIIAAFLTSCVVEPVLASLGGGGFLLAHTGSHRDVLYDFFAQTPHIPLARDKLDFYPIHADFGATTQEFHIGLASIATPGAIKGIFEIHRDLCTIPMPVLVQPAIEAARHGVVMTSFQAYIFNIIAPILAATEESRQQYQSPGHPEKLITEGELFKFSRVADFLDALAIEGSDLFYRGEIAQSISSMCATGGGQLTREDLADYRVLVRKPVSMAYQQHRVLTNPAPSCGGTLIAFALNMLEHTNIRAHAFGSRAHLQLLAETMKLTNEARFETHTVSSEQRTLQHLLDASLLAEYRDRILGNTRSLHGTTHMSVMDNKGNVAALTASNGEGCGHIVPDTGVMLNNMLGEEDLNPDGFYRWPANRRMTSMMAPTLVMCPDGRKISLGSGGSNRLRTAILQVLINIIDFGKPLHEAINQPRIHFESDLLSIEPGFEMKALLPLFESFANYRLWEQQNLFFGGVHTVTEHNGRFDGAGDQRRGGIALIVD
ncbi:MAG: gamma-glutamyltransferase [Gammaproteobacteria bacterium]|jgi:gamma-glutamyltranspeptidase/glutathione hydrolase